MATWSELKFKLIGTGDETGTWGDSTNANIGNAIEQAITGTADVTFSDADVHIYLTDSTELQNARALRLNLTGIVSTTRNLYVPNIQKFYIINNDLTEAITVQNESGTGSALTIPAGRSTLVFNTTANIVNPNTYFAGAVLSDAAVILGGAINDTPIGSLSASTGDFTTLAAASATLASPLPVLSGGTGVTTSTGTGNVVLSASPTLTGIPVAPTAAALTNTTQIATTAFVTGAITDKNLGTMSTQNANSVAITGGTINGTSVGATTTSTGAFTTLSSTGATTFNSVVTAGEKTTILAASAIGTIAYDVLTQSVLYYTTSASANWTLNIRGNSGTTLNSVMATGETRTVTFLVTQGATPFYNTTVQIDGTVTGVTTKWQGAVPIAGNASGIDAYTYSIVKTGSAAYTVFASQVQFK